MGSSWVIVCLMCIIFWGCALYTGNKVVFSYQTYQAIKGDPLFWCWSLSFVTGLLFQVFMVWSFFKSPPPPLENIQSQAVKRESARKESPPRRIQPHRAVKRGTIID